MRPAAVVAQGLGVADLGGGMTPGQRLLWLYRAAQRPLGVSRERVRDELLVGEKTLGRMITALREFPGLEVVEAEARIVVREARL